MYKRSCYIDGKRVNGKPDVRFETFPPVSTASDDPYSTDSSSSASTEPLWEPKLVVVTEVS